MDDLKDLLRLYDIQFSVDVEDVQKLVDMNPMVIAFQLLILLNPRAGHSMDWTYYHPVEDMHSYMD